MVVGNTLGADFSALLTSLFDDATGPSADLSDITLQARTGAPLRAHALVLRARCPHLAQLVSATAISSTQVDCERDELLNILRYAYVADLPMHAEASMLVRLRCLAQDFGLLALDKDITEALTKMLSPSLCCELLREVGREEARARLAHDEAAPTCAELKSACGEFATEFPDKVFDSDAFQHIPTAQQVWLFATCYEGHALHVLASALPAALVPSVEELLHALLAPPYSCAIDGLPSGAAGLFGGSGSGGSAAEVSPLQMALTKHNWRAATLLLDAGASTQPANASGGRTLLHAVAEAGDAQACTYLAQRGTTRILNAVDTDGYSPLDLAVLSEQTAAAAVLRERGGLTRYAQDGESLVHCLASTGRESALALLLSADNADVPNEAGLTPLQLATFHRHAGCVKLLLSAGADVSKAASGGGPKYGGCVFGTALHIASRHGDSALVEILLEKGANVAAKIPATGEVALHLAAMHPPVARLLLQVGAGLEDRDTAGLTPLQHAVVAPVDALACCRVLLDAGCRPNTAEHLFKQTPLHRLCDRRPSAPGGTAPADIHALEVLFLLHRHGANLNAQDKHGNTPLMYAAFRGQDVLALALVAGGASPNVPNNDLLCALSSQPHRAEPFRDARAVTKEIRSAMLARIAQPLPWLPDQMMPHCQICVTPFSASNRRHHCRHCGRIVCTTCSEHKLPILKFGLDKPTRVCNECKPIVETYGDRPLGPPSTAPAMLAAQQQLQENVAEHLDAQLGKTTRGASADDPLSPATPSTPPIVVSPQTAPPTPLSATLGLLPPAPSSMLSPPSTPPGAAAVTDGAMSCRAMVSANPFGAASAPADANPFGAASTPADANPFGSAAPSADRTSSGTRRSANPFGSFSSADLPPEAAGVAPAVAANPFDAEQVAAAMPNPFDSPVEIPFPHQ